MKPPLEVLFLHVIGIETRAREAGAGRGTEGDEPLVVVPDVERPVVDQDEVAVQAIHRVGGAGKRLARLQGLAAHLLPVDLVHGIHRRHDLAERLAIADAELRQIDLELHGGVGLEAGADVVGVLPARARGAEERRAHDHPAEDPKTSRARSHTHPVHPVTGYTP